MNKYSKDCKWCSEIFTSKQSKYRHEKNCKQNPDVDKLQCNGCGKKASRKDSLNRHKLKCKGAKELTCEICKAKGIQKEFTRPFHLKQHLKTHNKSCHRCDFCSKTFKRIDHYNQNKSENCFNIDECDTGEYSMVIINSGATRVAGARGQVFQNKSIFLRRTMEDH